MSNIRIQLFAYLLMAGFLLSGATVLESNAAGNDQVARITIDEVMTMQAKGEETIFIDTRNSSQWAKAKDKIPGAIRLVKNKDLADFTGKHPADVAIITYCT